MGPSQRKTGRVGPTFAFILFQILSEMTKNIEEEGNKSAMKISAFLEGIVQVSWDGRSFEYQQFHTCVSKACLGSSDTGKAEPHIVQD